MQGQAFRVVHPHHALAAEVAPGLGVELNEDVARANPWTGKDLHLMPAPRPANDYLSGDYRQK